MEHVKKLKCEIYNDSMQNWKKYPIQKAQLIIADVPYNVGTDMYGSSPSWYVGGDNKNGESKLAGKAAFASDFNFNLFEYFHFCSQLMKKEPKKGGARGRSSDAPCMIVFCSYQQQGTLISRRETWFRTLHSAYVREEVFTSGTESEYANCWCDREGNLVLSVLSPKIPERCIV